MKNKTLKIILIASILLNIFFATYLVLQKINPTFLKNRTSYRKQLLADLKLNLTEDQMTKIQSIFDDFKVFIISSKQEMLDKRMGIIEELSTPEPDLELLWDDVNQLNTLESNLNREFVKSLIKTTNILGSGQNIQFLLRLSHRWLYFGKDIKGGKK